MAITLVKITDVQYTSALEWISCIYPNRTIRRGFTAQRAYRIIQDHYDGGWAQFVQDLGDDIWY